MRDDKKGEVIALSEDIGQILNKYGRVEEQYALMGFIDGILFGKKGSASSKECLYRSCYLVGFNAAMKVEDVDVPDEEEE